jgi:exodeoxyribonuclease-5
MELTKDQQKWFDTIYDWYHSCKYASSSIVMAGFAGTGKTTITGHLVDSFHKDGISVACATFTGKASIVLSQKINNYFNNYIGTIHGLIYKPVIDKHGMLDGFTRAKTIDFDVIIVDECSMINREIKKDLLSFGVPVIFIGDSFQLPPISNDNFNIFEKTQYELKTIHRQAENSPIIKLSMRIRNGEWIDCGIFGRGCAKMSWHNENTQKALFNHNPNSNDIILCGMNKTRIAINNMIRKKQNFDRPEPKQNDKIVCLQNNHSLGIMNGQLGFVNEIKLFEDYAYIINMNFGKFDQNHFVYKDGFGKIKQTEYYGMCTKQKTKNDLKKQKFEKLDLFDFGYALSVHKSQGSSWDRVILIEERNPYQSDEEFAKWLYTGVTRAENKILIVEDF